MSNPSPQDDRSFVNTIKALISSRKAGTGTAEGTARQVDRSAEPALGTPTPGDDGADPRVDHRAPDAEDREDTEFEWASRGTDGAFDADFDGTAEGGYALPEDEEDDADIAVAGLEAAAEDAPDDDGDDDVDEGAADPGDNIVLMRAKGRFWRRAPGPGDTAEDDTGTDDATVAAFAPSDTAADGEDPDDAGDPDDEDRALGEVTARIAALLSGDTPRPGPDLHAVDDDPDPAEDAAPEDTAAADADDSASDPETPEAAEAARSENAATTEPADDSPPDADAADPADDSPPDADAADPAGDRPADADSAEMAEDAAPDDTLADDTLADDARADAAPADPAETDPADALGTAAEDDAEEAALIAEAADPDADLDALLPSPDDGAPDPASPLRLGAAPDADEGAPLRLAPANRIAEDPLPDFGLVRARLPGPLRDELIALIDHRVEARLRELLGGDLSRIPGKRDQG